MLLALSWMKIGQSGMYVNLCTCHTIQRCRPNTPGQRPWLVEFGPAVKKRKEVKPSAGRNRRLEQLDGASVIERPGAIQHTELVGTIPDRRLQCPVLAANFGYEGSDDLVGSGWRP